MSKKVVLTSARLEGELENLRETGYVLRQDMVLCNTKEHLSRRDLNVLSGFCFQDVLEYPISCIRMVFIHRELRRHALLEITPYSSGNARISVTYNEGTLVGLMESKLPVVGVGTESDEEEYALAYDRPIMGEYLSDMLMDNTILWRVFRNYKILYNCDSFSSGVIVGASECAFPEIEGILDELVLDRSFGEDGDELLRYVCGDCYLYVSNGEKVNLYYVDEFVDVSKVFSSESRMYEFADELGVELEENRGSSDSCRLLSEIDLDRFLENLYEMGYSLYKFGVCNIASIEYSRTVCLFRSGTRYMCVAFYYKSSEESFVMETCYLQKDLSIVNVEGIDVNIYEFASMDLESASTMVRGFDFDNMREYGLV